MSELLKVTDDLWCVWSNIADAPGAWGTRDEIRECLQSSSPRCPHCGWSAVDERFERAEAHGTSGGDKPPKGFVYNQEGWLPWERMEAFLRSYDGKSFDTSLLEPFEDD